MQLQVQQRTINLRPHLVVLALVLLTSSMTWSVLRPTPAPVPVVIGTVADFPPGSITKLDLAATFNDTMRPPPTRFILEGHPWYRRMSMIAQERWEQQFPPIVGQRMRPCP